MHGAWFIQERQNQDEAAMLKKISFGKNSTDNLLSLFNHKGHKFPFFILEDRSEVKKSLINKHEYLKGIKEAIEKLKGNLLIFGLSFNNDNHILEFLNESFKKEELKRIYITYIEKQRNLLSEKVNKNITPSHKDKIEYIQIEENVIWEKKKRGQI